MRRGTNSAAAITILMADDDLDDQTLTREAFMQGRIGNHLHMVSDGDELMDYLFRRNSYADPCLSPRPGLILLDLNMPRVSGHEALALIKQSEEFRQIPIVVLTTSRADEDILQSYDLGANSFISKPVTFEGLVKVMASLRNYWFEIVELPAESGG